MRWLPPLPFPGASASETMDRILHAQPEAIARFNYNVPAELERIVRKCLEKDRERRYQSARELSIDLKKLHEIDSGLPTIAKKGSPARPSPALDFCQHRHRDPYARRPCILSIRLAGRGHGFVSGVALPQ